MAKILTKNSVTAGSAPSGLSFGELAVNITDKKIFIGNAVEGVVTLHDQQNVVTSINGSTGAVVLTGLTASQVLTTSSNVNATRYLAFVGGTGTTGIFIDDVTTPLTYTPSGGAIGAKKLTLTTSAQVITVDSGLNTVTFTDGADLATFGLNSIAAGNAAPFEISNTNGLTFSANAIAFAGTGYGYLFPAANGTNGQALTTNGAGTLSWSTITGGLSWSAVTADRSLVAEEGVLANKSSGTLTLTLPSTAALGKVIRVSGMQNTWRIAQNASQKINFGNRSTTTGTGGYLENSNARDAVELVCCVANLEWNVISSIGNITIV